MLKSGLVRNFVINLGRSVILLLGVYLVWQGQVTIGTLIFVITLSEKAYFSLYRLSRFYDRMEEGKEAVNRFVDLNNEEPGIINPENELFFLVKFLNLFITAAKCVHITAADSLQKLVNYWVSIAFR